MTEEIKRFNELSKIISKVAWAYVNNKLDTYKVSDAVKEVEILIQTQVEKARREALEEAARIAERCELGNGDICDEIATAISSKINGGGK